MKRVMIDARRSMDFLYYDAFKHMRIPSDRLEQVGGSIKGVMGDLAWPFYQIKANSQAWDATMPY